MTSTKYVSLLDTTAVTFFTLYIEACDALGEDLWIDFADFKSRYESRIPKPYINFDDIKKGRDVLIYLNSKMIEFDGNIEIWFSLLNEIELLNILTDRLFDDELRRKLVPSRIRNKKLLRLQIDFDYDQKIFRYWGNMKKRIEGLNIDIQTPEGSRDGALIDTIDIAKIVAKYVNLTSVDLYLYAMGLHLRCDEILTHDHEMRFIINSIRNDRDWSDIRLGIQNDLISNFPSFKEEYDLNRSVLNFPKWAPS
ncbi:MAG: hypothetical protein M0Q43_00730 [Methanothrix sp.]|jgi:hypothetical protein|nr:hypothetical protein [Methanothrix sp.]